MVPSYSTVRRAKSSSERCFHLLTTAIAIISPAQERQLIAIIQIMGKKSKRRSTKNDDSHQSRLQERRERQLWLTTSEAADEDEDDERNDRDSFFKADNLEFFVGDWVWYRDRLRQTDR